jgi:probable rRNA maturation factor
MAAFRITTETAAALPRSLLARIKKEILGPGYRLNLIIVAPAAIRKLNAIYRDKDTATDILSFPLSRNEGDMYICPSETRKEAKKFDRPYSNFLPFLFIHGCVHLKGHDHGGTMERMEQKFRKKFGI